MSKKKYISAKASANGIKMVPVQFIGLMNKVPHGCAHASVM